MPRTFKRIVLKLSGEALREPGSQDNISPEIVENIAHQIKTAHGAGQEISVVVGGGNFWRGAAAAGRGMDRATADYVGMLATVMNAIALQAALEANGVPSRVQTAIDMQDVAEPFIRRRAIRHLERGRVVIFGGGTGNPFFTTDTTAALRASEIGADAIYKATKVDGVYDKDPNQFTDAVRYESLSFSDAISQGLKVMDTTAFSLCLDNDIPIVVFDMTEADNVARALSGEEIGTLVS
ncbi:MAG: UMP kinase [Verrucomicrobiota bacterium]